MPYYNDLRPDEDYLQRDYALVFPGMSKVEKKRAIENLLPLRAGLKTDITAKRADDNLLIATWNLKEFGHTDQRLSETYFYFAEIMSRLDLIIIQEVKSTLKDLYIVMRLLGHDWSYLVNDITEGTAGNSECSAYIFNNKRVQFGGFAGEIVLWDDLTRNSPVKQLKRTPYITGFKAGWKTFALINVHLHPSESSDDIKYRRQEVELLLAALKQKLTRSRLWNENLILAGDFNFYEGANKDDATIKLITDAGFREVESLKGKDTNASGTETYDRMFLTNNDYFTLGKNAQGQENGGVFNPFSYVFKTGTQAIYKEAMKKNYGGRKNLEDPLELAKYFTTPWRKNQLSDHYPIWFELIIDSADTFLADKLRKFV